ncbi:GlsB/YeaQ/YmgE family stress response membrane protein [soil metagenome]
MGLLVFLIVGLIAGFLARLLVPGRDPMGLVATLVLGIVGSFVGGMIFSLFSDDRNFLDFTTTGLIGSIIGAIVALLIYRQMKARA